ncbi:MAG TPA: hypothetical protein DCL31_18380 [Clostridium sp.]|nr:hypothetical protein [Clostridium sp.]
MDNEKALKYIKTAWVLAIVSSLLTLLVVIISVLGNNNFLGLSLYSLLDVVFVLGLAFGVYKKSRVCAVMLFIFFVLGQLNILISGMGSIGSFIMSVAFATGYFQGIRGTIHYHKNKKIEINEDLHKF